MQRRHRDERATSAVRAWFASLPVIAETNEPKPIHAAVVASPTPQLQSIPAAAPRVSGFCYHSRRTRVSGPFEHLPRRFEQMFTTRC